MFRSANNDEDSNSVPSGKNYVFDKRFSHAPGAIEAVDRTKKVLGADANMEAEKDCGEERILGTCESCSKPWVSMGRPPCYSSAYHRVYRNRICTEASEDVRHAGFRA